MEVAFDTKQLRDLCESQRLAERRMNVQAAGALRSCLADLSAAASVDEFTLVRPLAVLEEDGSNFVVPLTDNHHLRFHQNHVTRPKLEGGLTDWASVTRVKIVSIEHA